MIAGHDYTLGSRLTTVSMTVQYLSVAPGEDIIAEGRCTRRGKSLNFAEVVVSSDGGKRLAEGMLTVNVSGKREGPPAADGDAVSARSAAGCDAVDSDAADSDAVVPR